MQTQFSLNYIRATFEMGIALSSSSLNKSYPLSSVNGGRTIMGPLFPYSASTAPTIYSQIH